MEAMKSEDLGDTKVIRFYNGNDGAVQVITDLENRHGIVTNVRVNNVGELLYNWDYYMGDSNERYQPSVDIMIELQRRIGEIVKPHVANAMIDRYSLINAVGWGGSCGG